MYDNYQGITPAHAGKRPEYTFITSLYEDHPRTRGEKTITAPLYNHQQGSPPHTRGKVRSCKGNVTDLRITPAHAGKSSAQGLKKAHYQDHPRTRGEKDFFMISSNW